MNVVVMGVGFCGSFPASTGLSYREMIARAAAMAYEDAGIRAEQLDGAVSVEEDFVSGYSIADEYVPDQLGVQKKSIYTIPGDYLQGICSATMQIQTGRYKMLAVQSYAKASNILNKDELLHFAFDPVWNRMNLSPHYLAGLELQRFLECSHHGRADVADVVTRNRGRALGNPLAPYGAEVDARDVLAGRPVAEPLTETMFARHADAAVVAVLAAEEVADRARQPVCVSGTGWCSGSSILERRDHTVSEGTAIAGRMAYEEAEVASPADELDVVYVSDLYAHRQLMHLDALRLCCRDDLMVNPDGGSLGMGDVIEANGGARFYDAVRQLRGEAGAHQVEGAHRALVQGWRGLPTDSCAVAILDAERRQA